MKIPKYLCVYGTLMRGHSMNALMSSLTYVGTGTIKDWSMYSLGGFPGAVPRKGGTIRCEVYSGLSEEALNSLRRYEGYPRLYIETPVTVTPDAKHASPVTATIYQYNAEIDKATSADDGCWFSDWLEFQGKGRV